MTFALINARKAIFPIATMCRVLGVSCSGFYAWARRRECAHAQQDRRLRVLVRASFEESDQRYGSPRIHRDLLEQHIGVSRKRVIRLMQEDGLKARVRKRFTCTTQSDHGQRRWPPTCSIVTSQRTRRMSGGWVTRRNS